MQIITSHNNPDFDAIASMVAAQKLYPDAQMIIIGSPERNVEKFFKNFPDIFPFRTEKQIDLDSVSHVILVDTQSTSRIGKFKKLFGKKDVKITVYDHHPKKIRKYQPDEFFSADSGAVTTMLVNRIIEMKINLRPEEATIMLIGIYEETGAFRHVSTTPADFKAGAKLLEYGADITIATSYLIPEMDLELTRVLSQFLDSLEFINIRGFKIFFTVASFDHYIKDISFLIHKVRDIEDIDIIFALAQMDGKIHLIARSNQQFVDVGKICSYFGGGGHPYAASAVLRDVTLVRARENLIEYLHNVLRERYRAKDIMTSPVKSVTANTTVSDAIACMLKANFNTLPVVDDNGQMIGIITHADLDKASHHKLGNTSVAEYMSTHVLTTEPDAPLSEIQNIFARNNIGRVPVVKNERIIGIITRTDLLRALHRNYLEAEAKGMEPSHAPASYIDKTKIEAVMTAEIMKVIEEIGQLADKYVYNVYLVGGVVRDILLGKKNFDLDIVVEGNGMEFARLLAGHFSGFCTLHAKFATGVVTLLSGLKIDIATARMEYYQSPGALPTIETGSIKHDLSRRDFTINAMALKINASEFGELIDYFGGQQDIKNNIVRVMHNLSFIEDPTRIFRAIRFEQRLGFRIEKHTENLIKRAVNADLYKCIAYERIRDELIIILNEPKPYSAIERIYQFDELRFIDPAFCGKPIRKDVFLRIEDSITWFKLSYLDIPIEQWLVYFMGMLASVDYTHVTAICDTLKIQRKHTEIIRVTFRHLACILGALNRTITKPNFLYRILQPIPFEGLLFMMSVSDNNAVREKISHYFTRLLNISLSVDGNYIKQRGLTPSPSYTRIMKLLLYEKIDGKMSNLSEEQQRADKLIDLFSRKNYNSKNSD
ncbi:MAG: CBS domain-containing protein [Candidatus Auribacterota bacterium]|jgi:tRNA nucleotidyltransferase (CCA-adding enzyme)|nr:CBS domain-containing protein [Candidatus Auribacterota bacterium]